jgi:hypothetical protein
MAIRAVSFSLSLSFYTLVVTLIISRMLAGSDRNGLIGRKWTHLPTRTSQMCLMGNTDADQKNQHATTHCLEPLLLMASHPFDYSKYSN